jgi:hypothetical protein
MEIAMEARIIKNENGVEIEIEDLQGKTQELTEAFQECTEGRCTCPTQEYEKVETLEIAGTDHLIKMSIKVKENQEIDPQEIEKCIEYTRQRIFEGKESRDS